MIAKTKKGQGLRRGGVCISNKSYLVKVRLRV